MSVICIFGDSISWGAWDLEAGGWVNRLKLYFDNQPDPQIRVYNLGISGDRVGDVLKRFHPKPNGSEARRMILGLSVKIRVK